MAKRHRGSQKQLPFKITTANKVPVTKLDAARRQLETAIRLWFQDGDIVSIHTLTMASHEILRVINKSRGGRPMLSEPTLAIRTEYTDVYRDLVLEASRFFKHASRDADEMHFFAPALNQAAILDATEIYYDLTADIRPLFKLFKWYMRCHEPRLFHEAAGTNLAVLKGKSKAEFFSEFLPFAESPELMAKKIAELRETLSRGAFSS